jgi:DNA mismatch repair protein MutL
MPRIERLSPLLINQIAAGEVVERPASVLKELLENAIDAGSRRIDVEVSQGGTDLIQVVDDGCGIEAEDLPLAFASHATSKLHSTDDLFRIGTLGFRGEALASIGSIAQVTLQSRAANQPSGAAITCHGGQLSAITPWNGSPGTRIEVRHLFYNTPARRKFLKSVATEMGHVGEGFTRIALAQLGVHLTLRHNGRPVHDVPASVGLLGRIGQFFGSEVANCLYAVDAQAGHVAVGGYVGDPSCDRANSQLQYLFLNDRWVRDRGLFQAVQESYRGLLMTGRFPVAFLFLSVPPEQVDVNVHPAKAEVRFRDKDAIYQLVHEAVRECLRSADLTARMQLRIRKDAAPASEDEVRVTGPADRSAPAPPPFAPAKEDRQPTAKPREMPAVARTTLPPAPPRATPQPRAEPARASNVRPPAAASLFSAGTPSQATQFHEPQPPLRRDDQRVKEISSLPRALQVLDCYLVVEVPPDEVLFIDQHALHERILFEQLRQRLATGQLLTQRLLIPETVDLPASQAAVVLEHREALAELGLEVEGFGGGTLVLNSYPALLGQRSLKTVLRAVVDYVLSKERVPSREQLLNDLLSLMACHAAVRAGDKLTPEEITALLAQRELAQDSHHCPHGRPTSLRFTRHDLERHFKRV